VLISKVNKLEAENLATNRIMEMGYQETPLTLIESTLLSLMVKDCL